jgi:UDP-N-acetylglucosamine 2-epimerase (non-hydrolysing)
LGIPIGHVEAGLRTYNIQAPYPEEFNRQAVDIVTKYFFAPTEQAKQNLLLEHKNPEDIFVTGNTSIDALKTTINKSFTHPEIEWAKDSRLVLLTAHRRENLGIPLRNMFTAIRRVVEKHPDVKVIYPVHFNPEVREVATEIFGNMERIRIIEPLDVFDFHNFMNQAYLILTDSGGIQEEAPSLGKPVLVMRETTERPEGVVAGTLKLVGTNTDKIFAAFDLLLNDSNQYKIMSTTANPYGDGQASIKIADILEQKS